MQARHQDIKLSRDFPLRLAFVDNLRYPPHWHEHFEIIYVISGNIKAVIGDASFDLKDGHILIIPPACVHLFITASGGSKSVVIRYAKQFFNGIWLSGDSEKKVFDIIENTTFHYTGEESCKVENSAAVKIGDTSAGSIGGTAAGSIGGDIFYPQVYIFKIANEYQKRKDFYKEIIKADMTALLMGSVRNISRFKIKVRKDRQEIAHLLRINDVFAFIEKNHTNKITLADAAQAVSLSVYHFERLFKKSTGINFNRYLRNYRITKSEWYLANTDDTVTEAAFKVGFNSIQTFNRVFREVRGCTPTEFRKQQYLSN